MAPIVEGVTTGGIIQQMKPRPWPDLISIETA